MGITKANFWRRTFYILLIVIAFFPIAAQATQLRGAELRREGTVEQCVLKLTGEAKYRYFTLENPDRLVIDLDGVTAASTLAGVSENSRLITRVRSGQFTPATHRVVFELRQAVQVRQHFTLDADASAKHRIVFEIEAAGDSQGSTNPADIKSADTKPSNTKKDSKQLVKPEASGVSGDTSGAISGERNVLPSSRYDGEEDADNADKTDNRETSAKVSGKDNASTTTSTPSSPNAPTVAGTTVAERMVTAKRFLPVPRPKPALRIQEAAKPIIVIDPGHGGQDPGAIGPGGTQEKDITLAYGLALRHALLETGRYRVVMTRDDDRFILLRDRVAVGRKAGGNLFISLHADSAPSNARGLSVYTLSENASDAEAEALAARENKADVISGMDLSDKPEEVANILIDLAQRETMNKSTLFANVVVEDLNRKKVRLLENTHRFAGFAVLKAPDVPSVLIETGFLSHKDDEILLQKPEYRARLVQGLVKGIDAYFEKSRTAL